MNPFFEDMNRAKWNFLTLALSILSFLILKAFSDEFISAYGKNVSIRQIVIEGYLGGTLQVVGLFILTLLLFISTIYLATKVPSITALLQIIVSVIFIFVSFNIVSLPFLKTLFILIVLAGIFLLVINKK
ncbi:hypothetical protein P3U10_04595 [Mammaliicoccus sciuri]|uniref:hypothetical protein n=1 Tax=Mammaliicoccus sciuri TaxID=1296 RepID=UPI002B25B7C7|nr:hypothetical protein [Mammaliicoccus sciuri]WQK61461.1 hypothetical protein P3U10_04595 [Mammaliicoccus sciuri]